MPLLSPTLVRPAFAAVAEQVAASTSCASLAAAVRSCGFGQRTWDAGVRAMPATPAERAALAAALRATPALGAEALAWARPDELAEAVRVCGDVFCAQGASDDARAVAAVLAPHVAAAAAAATEGVGDVSLPALHPSAVCRFLFAFHRSFRAAPPEELLQPFLASRPLEQLPLLDSLEYGVLTLRYGARCTDDADTDTDADAAAVLHRAADLIEERRGAPSLSREAPRGVREAVAKEGVRVLQGVLSVAKAAAAAAAAVQPQGQQQRRAVGLAAARAVAAAATYIAEDGGGGGCDGAVPSVLREAVLRERDSSRAAGTASAYREDSVVDLVVAGCRLTPFLGAAEGEAARDALRRLTEAFFAEHQEAARVARKRATVGGQQTSHPQTTAGDVFFFGSPPGLHTCAKWLWCFRVLGLLPARVDKRAFHALPLSVQAVVQAAADAVDTARHVSAAEQAKWLPRVAWAFAGLPERVDVLRLRGLEARSGASPPAAAAKAPTQVIGRRRVHEAVVALLAARSVRAMLAAGRPEQCVAVLAALSPSRVRPLALLRAALFEGLERCAAAGKGTGADGVATPSLRRGFAYSALTVLLMHLKAGDGALDEGGLRAVQALNGVFLEDMLAEVEELAADGGNGGVSGRRLQRRKARVVEQLTRAVSLQVSLQLVDGTFLAQARRLLARVGGEAPRREAPAEEAELPAAAATSDDNVLAEILSWEDGTLSAEDVYDAAEPEKALPDGDIDVTRQAERSHLPLKWVPI